MVDSNNETIKKKKIVVKKKGMADEAPVNISEPEIDESNKPKSRVRRKANVSEITETPSMMDNIKEELEEELEEKKVSQNIPKRNNVDLSTRLKNFRNNRKKRVVDVEPETKSKVEEKEIPKAEKEIKIEKETKKESNKESNKENVDNKKQEEIISNNRNKNKSKEKEQSKNKKNDTSTKKAKGTNKESDINEESIKVKGKRKEKLPDVLFGVPKVKNFSSKEVEKKNKEVSAPKTKKQNKTSENKTIKAKKIKLDEPIVENRPKRVLKPKVSKVFTIISDVLYWLVFIFIVVLLFIVCVQRFSNNELSIGGIRIYNVSTESMLSKYSVGDIILAKDVDPSTLKIGDDIAYNGKEGQLEGKIITHEIQAITKNEDGSYTIITKGVQNDIEDPAINSSQIKGKIVKKLVILSAISKVASNNFGLFFAIFIPVAVIIFINMIRIMNTTDEQ